MPNEKLEFVKKQKKMFEFDPTIHAGHLLTAITIIFCSIGAWYDMKSSVTLIKEENARQDKRIEELSIIQKEESEQMNDSINALALMNKQEMTKMRDDMNQWFMRLSDKLDTKADKR